jgi:hypothetical protein
MHVVSGGRASALLLALACALAAAGCGGGALFGKVYEYEEDLYLSLDGSADLIINASIPALVSLRGLDLDTNPAAQVDREKIRALYESPITDVTRVSRPWRRNGRRYVQIRLSIDTLERLADVAPFSWSTYALTREGEEFVFRQTVGPSAHKPGTLKNYGWQGSELVAFRLHLPSRIRDHNARDIDEDVPLEVQRGNILSWEQYLTDRLDGRPVTMEVRMDAESILYRTLWLFAGAFAAAVLLLGTIIWLTVRKGARQAASVQSQSTRS